MRASKRGAVFLLTAGAIVCVAGTAWLLLAGPERPRGDAPPPRKPTAEPARAAPTLPEARGAAAATPTPSGPAADVVAASQAAAAQLRQALLDADRLAQGGDILEAKRLLAQVLRARPELAGYLAQLLGELKNRELAFQVARLLGQYAREPAVRAALLQHLASGSAVAREAAIYAFYGMKDDPEVVAGVARAFQDERADARVQAAAAGGLIDMLPAMAPQEREPVYERTRRLLTDAEASTDVRAEAVDLLDLNANAQDRTLVRSLLDPGSRAPRNVVFGACRALLKAGEPEAQVFPTLDRIAAEDPESPVGKSIRAILDEHRARGR